ncbi:MAG: TonB-dependent receptor [Chitinophagaceae bacterium]|nr:TonB-dependent receptor [Chitinophagaceae bacterium]
MKKLFICLQACSLAVWAYTQTQTVTLKILDKNNRNPVRYASVQVSETRLSVTADSSGLAHLELEPGTYQLEISHIGYRTYLLPIRWPISDTLYVLMDLKAELNDEVVIRSTRSSRTFQNIPTRVEFISSEELDEKANMKPGDIRMILFESTGIMTQTTSALSANAAIRIQGLDGKYTQLLKDGFPLFAGFSTGLGILQTPPLDLQQVEVIKGSASTLYGGGAIAGLVNLISKVPKEQRELKFHLDVTSAGGWNTSGFYSEKFKNHGITLLASRNSNSPYDPAGIGLTAIPEFKRYCVQPRYFFNSGKKLELMAGLSFTNEDRTGGDIRYLRNETPSGFTEKNTTTRWVGQFSIQRHFGKCSHITWKSSVQFFRRLLEIPGYSFSGNQQTFFTEMNYAHHGEVTEWIAGFNGFTDRFTESPMSDTILGNERQNVFGLFFQLHQKIKEKLQLEAGLRSDWVKYYGVLILPRLSLLVKFSPKLTSRMGFGMGYKTPGIFSEESERLRFQNLLPVSHQLNIPEKSYGINTDVNYKTSLWQGRAKFSVNQLFFYTRILRPLILEQQAAAYQFRNATGHFDSKGIETNLRAEVKNFTLFCGYSFTLAEYHSSEQRKENPLTPRHRFHSVLMYEKEEEWKIGIEAYSFSRQILNDGLFGRPYWIFGFMIEKKIKKLSLYVNFENFTDTRQTRFDSIFTGTIGQPVFRDIYAPLEGFVINGGIKLKL